MKILIKLIPLAGLMFCTQAQASLQAGFITQFYIENGGRMLFYLDGVRSPAPPSCAVPDGRWELAVDPTSPAGQEQVSALLTAQATHQRILVSGSNDCAIDSERVIYFKINPQ